jgi:hypothetical protein
MTDTNRRLARGWTGVAFHALPASIALIAAAACGEDPTSAKPGTGGTTGTSGGTSASTGGNSTAAKGGTFSGTGGTSASGTGGVSVSGKGGTTASGTGGGAGTSSTGGSGKGGAAASGGSGGGAGPGTGGKSSMSGGSGGSAGSGGKATAGAGGGSGGAVAMKSDGCGKTSTVTFGAAAGGTGKGGSVTIGNRSFIMRLPDNYDMNKPYWLIFGFHWRGGSSADVDGGGSNGYAMAHYGLQALSKNGAIFVAPHGLNGGWADGGDLEFVDAMVELIEDNYCVDRTHIFANGFSFGGGMSYALACARANVFRGVAIYNGAQLSGCEGGNDPIAVWQMHGLTDNTLGFDMALPMRDRFVENNGCTPQNPPSPPRPPPYLVDGGHICTDYAGCAPGKPVRWCAHQSGHGNAIVDGTDDLYHRCATPPMTCSDTCRCSWVPPDVWTWMNKL